MLIGTLGFIYLLDANYTPQAKPNLNFMEEVSHRALINVRNQTVYGVNHSNTLEGN